MFWYEGSTLPYADYPYNTTRLNERAIEVPIGLASLEGKEADTLEVGCVLPHYLPWNEPGYPRHTVLDLAEQWPGVINEDVFTWEPGRLFTHVISISTLEALGGREAWVRAFYRLKSWVKRGGYLLVTVPARCADPTNDTMWFTPAVAHGLTDNLFVSRYDKTRPDTHEWSEIFPPDRIPALDYDGRTRWANTVYLVEWWHV